MFFIAKKPCVVCEKPVFYQYFNGGRDVSMGTLARLYFPVGVCATARLGAAAEMTTGREPRWAFLSACGCAGLRFPGCQSNAYSVRALRPINRLPGV